MTLRDWLDHWLSQAPVPSAEQYEDILTRLTSSDEPS